MRLTLRTLLAYLDRILDPADADELQHKVDESERATQLIQRIERVLHERSTEALDIYATRHGLNPNSVAEYLDNQMQPEHVAEFERACLESDSHLAETAACHQILTKVLGQKAEVPTSLRQRLYDLRTGSDPASRTNETKPEAGMPPLAGVAAVPGRQLRWDQPASEPQRAASPIAAELVPASTVQTTPKTQTKSTADKKAKLATDADERWTSAPDYLTRPRRGWWQPWAIGLAIVLLLTIAGLRGMGPLDASHPVAKSLGLDRYLTLSPMVAKQDGSASDSTTPESASNANANRRPSALRSEDADESSSRRELEEPAYALDAIPAGDEADVASEVDALQNSSDPLPADRSLTSEDDELASQDATGAADQADDQSLANRPAADTAQPAADTALGSESDGIASHETPLTSGRNGEAGPDEVPEVVEGVAANSAEQAGDANESAASSPDAPEPPDLINPLDASAATNQQNEPVELVPALPRRDTAPEEVTEPGALGAAEGQAVESSEATEKPAVTDVGRFLNEQQVLVHFDPASESWVRMAAGTPLTVGQRLLSFPTFRPPIVLASGMQLTLIGATELEVMPPGADQTPFFQLHYGRAAVATFTSAGTRLGLQWGQQRTGTITLDDMTTLAFEVQQSYLPGADPSLPENQAHDLLFVYVMSGHAQWTSASGETLSLTSGKRMALVNNLAPKLTDVAELPLWIDGRDARPRDPIAAQDLAKRLTADRPVDLVLSELSVEKRVEQRSLALCCLAYLGQFDPLLAGFADDKLRAYWPMQYDVLVHLMNQGSESVARLKSALIQHHGNEDGQLIFEMLLGYTPQQLQDGSAEALVDHLNHPSSSVRFVANQTLRMISGLPTLYQAHGNERSRRTAVAKWRTQLQQGKVSYAVAPELVQLLNESKPAAAAP